MLRQGSERVVLVVVDMLEWFDWLIWWVGEVFLCVRVVCVSMRERRGFGSFGVKGGLCGGEMVVLRSFVKMNNIWVSYCLLDLSVADLYLSRCGFAKISMLPTYLLPSLYDLPITLTSSGPQFSP